MQNNKLRMAIRATAAVAVMGVASQAGAVNLSVGDDVEASLYGYARLNMTYDLNDNRAVSTRAGSFSPANEDIEGHFGADVQQSRLGIKVNHASTALQSPLKVTSAALVQAPAACACVTPTASIKA